MKRLLGLILALIVIACLIYVAVFFAENPGEVHIVWGSARPDPPLARLVAAVATLFVLAILLLWMLRALVRSPRAVLGSPRQRPPRERGQGPNPGHVAGG